VHGTENAIPERATVGQERGVVEARLGVVEEGSEICGSLEPATGQHRRQPLAEAAASRLDDELDRRSSAVR
jgi:hypothetical protein